MTVSATLAGRRRLTGYLNRCFVIESTERAQAVEIAKQLREQVSGGEMRLASTGPYFIEETKRRLELVF